MLISASRASGLQHTAHSARQQRCPLTVQRLHEEVAVLAHAQHINLRAEHLDAQALEHAHLIELDTDVERRLAAEREQHAVQTLLLQHVGDVVGRDGEEVDLRCVRVAASRLLASVPQAAIKSQRTSSGSSQCSG
jgi:hypothetical protein